MRVCASPCSFCSENPQKDAESAWRRAIEREQRRLEEGGEAEGEGESPTSVDEEETLSEVDQAVHVQLVRNARRLIQPSLRKTPISDDEERKMGF